MSPETSVKPIPPVLRVQGLQVEFRTDEGIVPAVDGVSFDVAAGETLGIVGESGSGKSVTNLAIMGLVPTPPGQITGGQVLLGQQDLLQLSARQMSDVRGRRVAMIFQDPMTALNPFLSIGTQMTEVTRRHLRYSQPEAQEHAIEMLERVGIARPKTRLGDYPHQFSGGMRQRVMIAMALSCRPEVLIADEPTTALDVSIQAQILDLIRELAQAEGTAIILITHDMGVVASCCDRVLVMYGGRIVETAPVDDLFARPRHPYSRGLLGSVPRLDHSEHRLKAIPGQPPDLTHLPAGCAFVDRCTYREARCESEPPALETWSPGRQAACFVDLSTIESQPPD